MSGFEARWITASCPFIAAGEQIDLLDVAANHAKPRVAGMLVVVPFPAGRKIVVKRDGGHGRIPQQPVGEVAANEAGAPHDEVTLRMVNRRHVSTCLPQPAYREQI